jgi:hypothetical protein
VVNATPRPLYLRERDPEPIVCKGKGKGKARGVLIHDMKACRGSGSTALLIPNLKLVVNNNEFEE